ncbi:uncharacterized protein B0I36DRAFT_149614 [Microdochium trichocladiopsis]|uniref:Uncharacterized protein n=1 Tax=Microdochium trichocladiopsis TaxID=1682393 RepID=A0A9P9BM17_9PEZI|nr:uncharacterized protein B0I36DRAFT_149614 [Microdochium trichocladiopsis]KAH7025828.1 hypothetical protein B0I36DRAFT_149614 [Microdochium trichocladiopsis]
MTDPTRRVRIDKFGRSALLICITCPGFACTGFLPMTSLQSRSASSGSSTGRSFISPLLSDEQHSNHSIADMRSLDGTRRTHAHGGTKETACVTDVWAPKVLACVIGSVQRGRGQQHGPLRTTAMISRACCLLCLVQKDRYEVKRLRRRESMNEIVLGI